MGALVQDLRYALRTLRKTPGFTAVAVLTLVLGIGANTAIFSLLDQVMLRLLPVSHPEQLVVLRSPGPTRGHLWSDGDGAQSFSFPMYKALREGNRVFSGLLACRQVEISVAYRGSTERDQADLVSGNYFEVLGVGPALGRLFTLDDDLVPDARPVVVLSFAHWQRRFGGDPSVLNQSILVNAHPMTVVGVVRRGFSGVQTGQVPDVFIPLTMKAEVTPNWNGLADWNDYWLPVLGRLKAGMTVERAEAGLSGLYRGLLEQQASATSHWSPGEREQFLSKKVLLEAGGRGRTVLQQDAGVPLTALFVMVGLVLLIVCTNLANLLTARGAARQRDLAVRLAIGASRGRLVSQLLTENLICAFAGGLLALPIAAWTLKALVAQLVAGAGVEGLSFQLDARVLVFGFALTLIAGLFFGLAPAFRATRADLHSAIKSQTGSSASPSHVRFRKAMVAIQVVFTVLLLAGAGLFTRTLWNLRHVNLGLEPSHVISLSIAPALNGYSPAQAVSFCERALESLAAVPGVRSASAAEIAPLTNSDWGANITVPGAPPLSDDEQHVRLNQVAPDYFSTLGIPLVAGREFTASDGPQAPKVAIVNESMVKRFFPGREALGSRFAFGGAKNKPDILIVGVVKDAKNSGVRESNTPYVYFPYEQDDKLGRLTFYARTAQDPAALGPALRKAVQNLDLNLPVFDLQTLEFTIDQNLFAERLVAVLSLGFGALAALLAALGIYGVLAYTVVSRTREIGIRMAVGAQADEVRRLVYAEVAPMLVTGIVIGLPLAFALARLTESLLYGVHARDFGVYLSAFFLVTVTAMLASYFPARRATKVDPMVALRHE
jgi:predicted permease